MIRTLPRCTFKAEAVALYRSRNGATIAQIVDDLGTNRETLRSWVRIDDGKTAGAHRPKTPGPAVGDCTARWTVPNPPRPIDIYRSFNELANKIAQPCSAPRAPWNPPWRPTAVRSPSPGDPLKRYEQARALEVIADVLHEAATHRRPAGIGAPPAVYADLHVLEAQRVAALVDRCAAQQRATESAEGGPGALQAAQSAP